jgi:hypothetical protein
MQRGVPVGRRSPRPAIGRYAPRPSSNVIFSAVLEDRRRSRQPAGRNSNNSTLHPRHHGFCGIFFVGLHECLDGLPASAPPGRDVIAIATKSARPCTQVRGSASAAPATKFSIISRCWRHCTRTNYGLEYRASKRGPVTRGRNRL